MKTIISTLALAFFLSAVPSGVQAAVQKVGTINLQKVYTDYWKTKKADEALKRKALDKQKVAEGIEKDLRDLDGQIRKAEKLLQDQTLNAAERDRRIDTRRLALRVTARRLRAGCDRSISGLDYA